MYHIQGFHEKDLVKKYVQCVYHPITHVFHVVHVIKNNIFEEPLIQASRFIVDKPADASNFPSTCINFCCLVFFLLKFNCAALLFLKCIIKNIKI